MKLTLFLAVICLFFVTAVFAQAPTVLTLVKAVEIALQNNTQVIQAQNTVEGRQSAVTAAYGGLLPTLDAGGSYSNRQNWAPVTGGGSQYIPGLGILQLPSNGGHSSSDAYSAELDSRWTLFNGFGNYAAINSAKANANASQFTSDRTIQSTVLEIHTLFLNVVRTFQLMKVNEDNVKRSQRQLEQIEESNKVGSAALADVYRQRAQVGSDEFNLITAQTNYENAKMDLIFALGVDFNKEYQFDFTGIPTDIDTTEFVSVNANYADFGGLMSTALEKRPDYQSAVETLNSADAGVSGAKASFLPSISASGSFLFSNDQLSTITDNKNLNLSLSVSIPIFSGFSLQSQLDQAEVTRKNADEGLKEADRQVRIDIRKALLGLQSAEKQVVVAQSSVQSALMDQQIAEEKYHLGASTLLDLLTANANYTTALSNKVNAVAGYLVAKKTAEFAIGTISK
ncbi:MAG TPA: TolC family protein [Bacteroidota bacterium]|nr:TolC family protein [Bacteroidota bacterium]